MVEDNADDVALTRQAFTRNHIRNEIVVARDGPEALEAVFGETALPTELGLILLDLNLPKISGLEVIRKIRGDERGRFVPIVVLTGSEMKDDISESYRRGANAYIRKPVAFADFTDAMKTVGTFWLLLNQTA